MPVSLPFIDPAPAPGAAITPAVRLDHISRVFGAFAALRHVSLALAPGSSAVLLGENGAGKSTLLRLVAGLSSPSFGSVEVFGQPPENVRGRIAYMSHATMLYDELSGVENLTYFAGLYSIKGGQHQHPPHSSEALAADALREVGLDPANPRRVGEYSQGMRQRAALARVLMTGPDLLLLDEPFSNLDALSAERMIERLLRFRHEGAGDKTLLLTTHQAELAWPLAQTTIRLRAGRLDSVEHRSPADHNSPAERRSREEHP